MRNKAAFLLAALLNQQNSKKGKTNVLETPHLYTQAACMYFNVPDQIVRLD